MMSIPVLCNILTKTSNTKEEADFSHTLVDLRILTNAGQSLVSVVDCRSTLRTDHQNFLS